MRPRQMSEDREPSTNSPSSASNSTIVLSSTNSSAWQKSISLSDASSDKADFSRWSSISEILDARNSSLSDDAEGVASLPSDEDEPPCKLFRWGEDGYEFVGGEDFPANQVRPTLSYYSWTPSSIRFSSLEGEGSPKLLFRDMPVGQSMRKSSEPSSPASSTLVGSPKTPNRTPIANDCKTPARSLVHCVDSLSPIFDKLKVERKKITPASISPSPLATTSKSTSASSYQPIVLLVSESAVLDYPALLAQFVAEFKAEIVKGQFEQRVTHVLLDEDSYTKLEHIQAVAFKKYLVKLSWIYHCLREERLLEPASFEDVLSSSSQVPPTCLARSSVRELFRGYAFFCAKPFYSEISYDQLVELLLHNGGEIVSDPQDFAMCKSEVRVCIVGEPFYYIIEKNKQELRDRLEGCKCVKVHHQWIFEVFATFRLQPLIGYLYDSTPDVASTAGVPRSLLG